MMVPLCEICNSPIEDSEGYTHICDLCENCGYCSECARPENHDCEAVRHAQQQPARFALGDYVRKREGSYAGATGWIVSVFRNRAGAVRYVMEFEALPGLLHIFSEAQLEAA